jgi:transcriptional regulator with XRE-family HTH domain
LFDSIEHTMTLQDDDTFGSIVKKLRLDAEIGLRELAGLIEKSPGYLSDIESGRVPPPKEAVILHIADALNADRAALLSAAGKVDPEISEYVAGDPGAADFLRKARDRGFADRDWDRLNQLAEIAGLGKEGEKK